MRKYGSFIILFVGLVILNLYAFNFDHLWDLTFDQKYTISAKARKFIRDVPEGTIITVLLEGNVPVSFKNYRGFIDYYLKELRKINRGIEVIYKDPGEGSAEEVASFRSYLASYGVSPMSRRVTKEQSVSQSLIYPFISIHNQRRAVFVDLLGSKRLDESEEEAMLNAQISFESKLLTSLRDISRGSNGLIGIVGNDKNVIARSLNEERGKLGNYYFFPMSPEILLNQIDTLDAIISVVKSEDLTRMELLSIDQCHMAGVPIIWLMDKYQVTVDSIGIYGEYLSQPSAYNGAEDMLFKHGVRLSNELLQNLDCSAIPQVVGQEGGRAKTELIPFPYHVLGQIDSSLGSISDKVNMKFVTPIELLSSSKKTTNQALLRSTEYNKLIRPPSLLSFEFLRFEPNYQDYSQGSQVLAVSLSGDFESYFNNRLSESDKDYLIQHKVNFKNSTKTGEQIVVSDVDFIMPMKANDGSFYPLGFNFWDRITYDGNKIFVRSLLEYAVNDGEMLSFTKKAIKTSLVDKGKFDAGLKLYYFLLLVMPVILSILLVVIVRRLRKFIYAKAL